MLATSIIDHFSAVGALCTVQYGYLYCSYKLLCLFRSIYLVKSWEFKIGGNNFIENYYIYKTYRSEKFKGILMNFII